MDLDASTSHFSAAAAAAPVPSFDDVLAALPSPRIELIRRQLTDAQLAVLLESLSTKHAATAVLLNLEGNLITNTGAELLGTFLAKDKHLKELNVSFNRITGPGCESLAKGLLLNTTLQKLSLIYNTIDDAGAEALAKVLRSSSVLEELLLYKCSISDSGIGALTEAILDNSHAVALTTLDVGNNRFGSESLAALSSLISGIGTLRSLSLRGCDIRPVDLEEMCVHLRDNDSLKSLDLRNNKIADSGAKMLAEVLVCTRLEVLDLQKNSIGLEGMTALSDALRTSDSLSVLNLADNKVECTGQAFFPEMTSHLRKNKSLQDALDKLRQTEALLRSRPAVTTCDTASSPLTIAARKASTLRALTGTSIDIIPEDDDDDYEDEDDEELVLVEEQIYRQQLPDSLLRKKPPPSYVNVPPATPSSFRNSANLEHLNVRLSSSTYYPLAQRADFAPISTPTDPVGENDGSLRTNLPVRQVSASKPKPVTAFTATDKSKFVVTMRKTSVKKEGFGRQTSGESRPVLKNSPSRLRNSLLRQFEVTPAPRSASLCLVGDILPFVVVFFLLLPFFFPSLFLLFVHRLVY
eukprot:m.272935 g.272935  ORF g.272935 m.272935 type:complete len:580 (-) comp54810_c0_seq3:389-2128(-)